MIGAGSIKALTCLSLGHSLSSKNWGSCSKVTIDPENIQGVTNSATVAEHMSASRTSSGDASTETPASSSAFEGW